MLRWPFLHTLHIPKAGIIKNFGLTNGYAPRLNKLSSKNSQEQNNRAIGCIRWSIRITMKSIKAQYLRRLKRFVLRSKVDLVLSFLKTQPHSLDLLMRANAQAIAVLKHCLRQSPKARQLRSILPEPKLLEKCGKYGYSAANLAVCVVILLFMKISVLSSMDKLHTEAQKVVKQYYARQVGQDFADEIFQ
jgi:hypothetical protein